MATQDLIIRIRQELEGKGIKELQAYLKELQKEYDGMIKSNERGTQAFADQIVKMGIVSKEITTMKNEMKGIAPVVDETTRSLQALQKAQASQEGSLNWLKAQKQYWTDVMNSVNPASKEYEHARAKVLELRDAMQELSGETKKSHLSIMEYGENINIVAQGIQHAIREVVALAKEIGEIAMKGAEFEELHKHFETLAGSVTQAEEQLQLFRKATGGRMNDEELLKFSNKMQELGYNTEMTAQILDIGHDRAVKLGTGLEESNSKLIRFLETGKSKGLVQFGISISQVSAEMKRLTGLTEKQIKELDTEEQIRLRGIALVNLYGKSLADINEKQQNQVDKLKALEVASQNARLRLGEFISGGVVKVTEALGLATDKTAMFTTIMGGIGTGITTLIPLIANLRLAFMGLQISMGWIAGIGVALTALGVLIANLVTKESDVKGEVEEANRRIKEQVKIFEQQQQRVKDLATVKEHLRQTTRSSAEQEKEYSEALDRLATKYPTLVKSIRDKSTADEDAKRKVDALYDSEQKLLDVQQQRLLATLKYEASKLLSENQKLIEEGFKAEQQYNALGDAMIKAGSGVNEFIRYIEELRYKTDKTIGDFEVLNTAISKAFNNDSVEGIQKVLSERMSEIAKNSDHARETSALYKQQLAGIIQTASGLNVLDRLLTDIAMSSTKLQALTALLTDTYVNFGAQGIASLFGTKQEAIANGEVMEKLTKHIINLMEAVKSGNVELIKQYTATLLAEIKTANENVSKLEFKPPKVKAPSTRSTPTKTERPEKTAEELELEALQKLIEEKKQLIYDNEQLVTLGEQTLDQQIELYNTVIQTLEAEKSKLKFDKNIQELERNIRDQQIATQDLYLEKVKNAIQLSNDALQAERDKVEELTMSKSDLILLYEEETNKLQQLKIEYQSLGSVGLTAVKEIDRQIQDNLKNIAKLTSDVTKIGNDLKKQISTLKLDLESDNFQKIKMRYDLEREEIKKKYGLEKKFALELQEALNLINRKELLEIQKAILPTLKSSFSSISNVFTSMSSLVKDATKHSDNSIALMLDGIARAFNFVTQILNIIEQIKAVIEAIKTIGTIFDIISSGAKMAVGVPFASGGFVTGGSGVRDDVPIMAMRGEFIVRQSRVKELLRTFGADFFAWLNGGRYHGNSLGKYATGGLITASAISSDTLRLEVADTKIKGNDIYLSWRRTKKIIDSRIK